MSQEDKKKQEIQYKNTYKYNNKKKKMINQSDDVVLAVDLDGTLTYADTLHESILLLIKHSFLNLFLIIFWIFLGKAEFKKKISDAVSIDASLLPLNNELIEWLIELKLTCRKIILSTAADSKIANAVAEHLKIFDEVISSDGRLNNSGAQKKNYLDQKYGEKNYDYVGNSYDDISVWRGARNAILVSSSARLIKQAKLIGNVSKIFSPTSLSSLDLIHLLRLHQWLKNLLLFVPLCAAHLFNDVDSLLNLIVAFLAFSMCASSVYMLNDLLDLESDRKHSRKRFRPFASGFIQIKVGIFLIPILILFSSLASLSVGNEFFLWLFLYLISTTFYSFSIKKYPLMDVFFLAYLYTLRVVAGAVAVNVPQSFWLLAFSIFIFLSLAFVKRFTELKVEAAHSTEKISGRGYLYSDAPLVNIFGVVAGYCAVVILALYVNSTSVTILYRVPEFAWGAVLAVLYWISWVWFKAHRGEIHDDPLVFAIKDRVSRYCLLIAVISMFFASFNF
jgi:4-hydroxybenzoate polyprenyltransferase